jgi:A/G-specific adenine glycosylase
MSAKKVTEKEITQFQKEVWDFYHKNRRSFPWRETTNPYKILVSEIMLQQTQADRVVRFYEVFLKRFPNPKKLAEATFTEIYPYWQGLGYNRRAMNLKKAAEKSITEYKGKFPENPQELEEFPGIGPYTSKAVAIFSANYPVACIETNIRRVFIHHFFKNKKNISDESIMRLAELALPKERSREWHWALMDYGAYLKTVVENPNRRHENYSVQSKFEGSARQARGMILKMLSAKEMSSKEIEKRTKRTEAEIIPILEALAKEGFVVYYPKKKVFSLR